MIYKQFKDKQISALGMGCMRLPIIDGKDDCIDIKKTKDMIRLAMENGVNYYDTAWVYHLGLSESVMGDILKDYKRESFYLATKFPGFELENMDKVEEIFEKQLEKCQVEYFDFYLFHNVCEMNIDGYLDPKYRIHQYLMEQKKKGRIKHLGFSTHGNMDTMKRFLSAYGKDMEFCQLQINWVDWEFQNAKEKVELVSSYGIPVWVMEPVRGGSLASLNQKYLELLDEHRAGITPAEWAFRYVQSIPEVTVTLSGMSNEEQLKQNIETFSEAKPLTDKEKDTLHMIARDMTGKKALACTACRYCTSHCVQALDIPWLISLYNEHIYSGGGFIAPMALSALSEDKLPSACLACKACEEVCPQGIKISEMMQDFAGKLNDE